MLYDRVGGGDVIKNKNPSHSFMGGAISLLYST
jgi:hypothetical protein